MMIFIEHAFLQYRNGSIGLADVSFSADKGDFMFIVGPTGCGKTSLFRLIYREVVPQRGKVYVLGKNVVNLPRWRVPYLRRNIGVVFQDFRLLPHRTAWENVAYALQVMGAPHAEIEEQVEEALSLVGLLDKGEAYPELLSGGEMQRVSLARAIANRPPILLADEPTGNLDPDTSLEIIRLLERVNLRGTTVLVATHDKYIVDAMAKTVVRMENGRITGREERGTYSGNVQNL